MFPQPQNRLDLHASLNVISLRTTSLPHVQGDVCLLYVRVLPHANHATCYKGYVTDEDETGGLIS